MSSSFKTFANIDELARNLRETLENKKYVLIYAYNGTGKTRLSMAFKNLGRNGDERDTLYFNAFTEDLFTWDNDLKNDRERVLKINKGSRFFDGLEQLEMDTRIRKLLGRYADFDFKIDTTEWEVSFSREITTVEGEHAKTVAVDDIKISRGEENIFKWCFFLVILQMVLDDDKAEGPYKWVKYIYIDDPISSLDDNNAIAVASHLAQMLKKKGKIKTVISSHHTLFFNVMCNELGNATKYFLSKDDGSGDYVLRDTGDTPFFHHVALLKELHNAAETGKLYTYHFNMLRSIMEKTATFHGFKGFSECIKQDKEDEEGVVFARIINVLSHGNYSLFDPVEMLDENKAHFRNILNNFMKNYRFNRELFPEEITQRSNHDQARTKSVR